MPRRKLTDRTLKGLKARADRHYDIMDSEVPGLAIRVLRSGIKSFVLVGRFPGSKHATRLSLGEYAPLSDGEERAAEKAYRALPEKERESLTLDQYMLRTYGSTSLAAAREQARRWRRLIALGKHPKDEEARQRQVEAHRREHTFAAVVADFVADKLPGERKGVEVERDIRGNFVPVWGKLPITDITDEDIVRVVKGKAKTAPAQARNLLGHAKRLFSWAVDQRCYGLKLSPAERLKPSKLVGDKISRQRILTDAELFALWRATERLPYPYGPTYRLLILTALRLNEAADAAWPEFHPTVVRALSQRQDDKPVDWSKIESDDLVWTVPEGRMKGKNGKARPHVVPLTADILKILEAVPRFKTGDYLFSTTFGKSPAWMNDKVKKRIDERMLRTLRALARRQGDDPRKVKLEHWTNHDIRRTVRSNLSRLKITEEAREAVLAHVRPGIKGTYDLHDYLDEKRQALELWAARLRSIVEPTALSNVVELKRVAT
jgi:hypothetical protein